MEKPKPPLCRVIREGTIGTCPKCHSTEERKYNFLGFSWGKVLGCINPECENYYDKCTCENKGLTVWRISHDGVCLRCGNKYL